jgi:hypothetical protein
LFACRLLMPLDMRKSDAGRKGNRQENHRFITESRGANLVPNRIGTHLIVRRIFKDN